MEHNKIVQQKDHIILPKATLGRQVDGLIPVFPPIFIGPFFLRFPAFRHSVTADLYAGFAFGGGGAAADMFDKGTLEGVRVELARGQNGWHGHNYGPPCDHKIQRVSKQKGALCSRVPLLPNFFVYLCYRHGPSQN